MSNAFFGYGSLVNLTTHDYPDARPATLTGWRRVWKGTHLRQVAYLSVEPSPEGTLHGVVAAVPNNDWAALDAREAAYDRIDISHAVTAAQATTVIYHVSPTHIAPDGAHPILMSYLDVVVQGFLQLYGHDGVRHFFDTTDGWHLPVLDDRAAPLYPRHRRLDYAERRLVDTNLAAAREKAGLTTARTPAAFAARP